MNQHVVKALAAAVLAAVSVPATSADGADDQGKPQVAAPDEIQWRDNPPALPHGAKVAVLEGDLSEAEPFTLRLRLPEGYVLPAHRHPVLAHLTVVKGDIQLSTGDELEREDATRLPAGGFHILPQGMAHAVWAVRESVIQLHGVGPWGITYVDPADDPRKD